MDNKSGGQNSSNSAPQDKNLTSEERQRQTAIDLARQKVVNAYKAQPQNYRPANQQAQNTNIDEAEWKKYHSAWQDYYQKYYGEYYNKAAQEYIAKEKERIAAEQKKKLEAERERLKEANQVDTSEEAKKLEEARKRLKNERLGFAVQKSNLLANAKLSAEQEKEAEEAEQSAVNQFRSKLRKKVEKRAKKMRKSRHFVPIMIAIAILVIGILFQYNQSIIANIVAYISPGGSEGATITAVDPTVVADVHENPTLMIPKLNVEVPIVLGVKNDVESMNAAMSNGVAQFSMQGASALPGQIGNFAVSGHSSNNFYESGDYKFIFSGLSRLGEGDLVYVDYEGKRYTYRITGNITVEPTEVHKLAEITSQNAGKPMITLITCMPLGTSRYRLLVYGEQIYPDYTNAEHAAVPEAVEGETATMETTANSPTPLGQFWNWLTGQN